MADGTPIIIKKKKAHGHGHHGGAWKVAYADFVTAMMAFFMVMWIMGMSAETRSMVSGYFNDPVGFIKNEPKARPDLRPFRGRPNPGGATVSTQAALTEAEAAQKLKQSLSQAAGEGSGKGDKDGDIAALFKNVRVKVTPEGVVVDFIENAGAVFFEVGSANIRPGAMKLIQRLAPTLGKAGRKMFIEGHTDSRPFPGSGYDNFDLSNARAQALRRALKSFGIGDARILGVRGYADKRLAVPEDPYSFANRRVSLVLPFDSFAGAATPKLPRELLKNEIQGAFKRPVNIEPEPVDIGD